MKNVWRVLSVLLASSAMYANAQSFDGAVAFPYGKVTQNDINQQFQIKFPSEMVKVDAFKVACNPAVEGFSSWANNNSIWTYNLKVSEPGLPGGTKCQVTQTLDLQSSIDGKTWKAGTINYEVQVKGPNVTSASPVYGFNGFLRESEAIMLLRFDGDIDRNAFWANKSIYLNYVSANAPAEKVPLKKIPADKMEEVLNYVKEQTSLDETKADWMLVTVGQNLVPGAKMQLNVANVVSGYDSAIKSDDVFTQELVVRNNFQAKVECARTSTNSPTCMPQGEVTLELNAKAKWSDVQKSYIEYIPYKSKRKERAYPELNEYQKVDAFDSVINWVSQYIPAASRFSDTLVESVVFKVQFEPETLASVHIAGNLKDIDNRELRNTPRVFNLRIGSPKEVLRVPRDIAFFERGINNVALPVGVVNLNQELVIRKTGEKATSWAALKDLKQIIQVIRAYASRGDTRNVPNYVSPMETLGLANNVATTKLTGQKNRSTYLQFPFAKKGQAAGGLYALEISSPSLEQEEMGRDYFLNPQYVLAQVTNLAVHLKQGSTQTVVWVTALDSGKPVAAASVEVRNCLGDVVVKAKTDANGLATFQNKKEWAADCKSTDEDGYDYNYGNRENYFVAAKSGDDFTFTHSSWAAEDSWAYGAPGVDYVSSALTEGSPFFHSVIGVNLVKPGQKVPVQLIAKMPTATGFAEVPAAQLPKMARVLNTYDSEVYFDFPLTWNNGVADFEWQIQDDSSTKLGSYEIQLFNEKGDWVSSISNSDIEVAEFKVPLMSGSLAFPSGKLVRPTAIPVNALVKYANGIGAKSLGMSISYFFDKTQPSFEKFENFKFGSGKISVTDTIDESAKELPSEDRPAMVEGLSTNADGSVTLDIGAQGVSDGKTVADLLKTVKSSQRLVVRAKYQDQMGEFQTLSQSADIYTSPTYVGTMLSAGTRAEARLKVAVVGVDGKPVTAESDLALKVYKVETKVIGEELFGGLIRNTYEREIKEARWTNDCQMANGILSCQVGTLKAGSYAFEATSKQYAQSAHVIFKIDESGRVYGSGDYIDFGDQENSKILPLALNKPSYKVGEKAVVSFSAPFKKCQALVTLERENVVRSMVVPNACERGAVEIPVLSMSAPNTYVSIYAITGRTETPALNLGDMDMGRPTYRIGFANMMIDIAEYKLNVKVATDKRVYKPKDFVNVKADVAAEVGSMQNAKVTFVAIEEKILELKENRTYDIVASLLQLRSHGVQTLTGMDMIETVTAKDPDGLDIPTNDSRKGGDDGGDGGAKGELKRKLFDALVKMETNVPVVNGVATWKFTANDSLTNFKVIAIVTDSSQKFGSADVGYSSAQDTQTFANIPPVAHTGDGYPVRVNVQNNTGKDQSYTVEVEAIAKDGSGKVVDSKKLSKKQSVGSSSSVAVDVGDYAVHQDAETIEYVVRVYDEKGNLVDVLTPDTQKVMPSVPLAVRDSLVLQTESGRLNRSFSKDQKAILQKGDLTASVSSSLVDGANSLIKTKIAKGNYAQSMFLQDRLIAAMFNGSANKPEGVKAVLETLVNYVDSDGLVKYYASASQGSAWLTASMLQTIGTESWAVAQVPAALKAKFAMAVKGLLKKTINLQITDQQWFELHVLVAQSAANFGDAESQALAAGIADAAFALTAEQAKAMTNNNLAEALVLLEQFKGASAKSSTVWNEMVNTARIRVSGNQATLEGVPSFNGYYTDETVDSSKLLMAYAKLGGPISMARPLAIGLVNGSSARWYIPETMMWVSQGLKSFARKYEADAVSGKTEVAMVNSGIKATVDWAEQSKGIKVVAPWATQTETVAINHIGNGQPWVSLLARSAVPLTAANSQGLSIIKAIKNLTRTTGFQAGDIVQVEITINSATTVSHITMMDPIPAGSNIVGEGYGAFSSGEKSYRGYSMYFEYLTAGESTVTYQYQLNNVGTFNLPPTRAEGVYLPSIFGETPNATVVVK